MTTLKKITAGMTMAAILTFGTVSANAGIIVAGKSTKGTRTSNPCTASSRTTKADTSWGIIVAGIVGIIVAGKIGIIVAGANETPQTNCGIIVAG